MAYVTAHSDSPSARTHFPWKLERRVGAGCRTSGGLVLPDVLFAALHPRSCVPRHGFLLRSRLSNYRRGPFLYSSIGAGYSFLYRLDASCAGCYRGSHFTGGPLHYSLQSTHTKHQSHRHIISHVTRTQCPVVQTLLEVTFTSEPFNTR